ncbi:MAG: helix-turn-helix transcriptional regulator [Bacillota bacterium]
MLKNTLIKDFAMRLATLRQEKNLSARDLSLSLGQCHNYINNIESGRNFPTMASFFYICDYLEITPSEFLDYGNLNPTKMTNIVNDLRKLDSEEIDNISKLIKNLIKNKKGNS